MVIARPWMVVGSIHLRAQVALEGVLPSGVRQGKTEAT